MTRAQMFKSLALGGASVAAVHLHGDGHTISHCMFNVSDKAPAAMWVDRGPR